MGFKYLTYFEKGYIQWTGIPCEIQRPNDLFSLAGSHRLPLYPLTIYFWSRPLELTCYHHFPSIDSGEINPFAKLWNDERKDCCKHVTSQPTSPQPRHTPTPMSLASVLGTSCLATACCLCWVVSSLLAFMACSPVLVGTSCLAPWKNITEKVCLTNKIIAKTTCEQFSLIVIWATYI